MTNPDLPAASESVQEPGDPSLMSLRPPSGLSHPMRRQVKRVHNLASQIRKGLTASQNSKPHRLAMLFNLKRQAKLRLRFLRGCAESHYLPFQTMNENELLVELLVCNDFKFITHENPPSRGFRAPPGSSGRGFASPCHVTLVDSYAQGGQTFPRNDPGCPLSRAACRIQQPHAGPTSAQGRVP